MGGGPSGPSKSQIQAEQGLRKEEMQMQQAQFNKQMAQQAQMAQLQQQQAEQARQDAMADRKRIE